MFDFFKTLFKPSNASGETAKERLRLVLLSDHLSLAPEVVESLKRDLMEVISRYVEIDSANADVTFEHREREIAMLASIPITGVRDRKAAQAAPAPRPSPVLEASAEPAPPLPGAAPAVAAVPAPEPAPNDVAALAPAAAAAMDPELDLSVPPPATAPKTKPKTAPAPPGTPAHASNAGTPRRRRRKKYAAAAAATKRAASQQSLGGQASAQA